MMDEISLGYRVTFDAAHRLKDHGGPCRNLHGHTYCMELAFTGQTGENGMICDFGALKQIVNEMLHAGWDHHLILQKSDPLFKILADSAEKICIVDMEEPPTVENMLPLMAEDVRRAVVGLPVEVVSIRLYETPECWADLFTTIS